MSSILSEFKFPNLQDRSQSEFNKILTLIDLLSYRANYQPNEPAFIFLQNGEVESNRLTYQELEQQAKAIATQLQTLGTRGERALLLYPPGLEFITAFFGCLYAEFVAVPAYPPRRNQKMSRIEAILADAQVAIVLTTQSLLDSTKAQFVENLPGSSLQVLATDKVDKDLTSSWQQPDIDSNTLAFLQYTSGSTGTPKGVMVTHGNLLHNERMIEEAFGHIENTIVVGWLPLFHDMGLIGNVLQPLYLGRSCILMSPLDFLQKPARWLQAISHYQATTSGGPNFAYELAYRKITSEQSSCLDLSRWTVAFTGAEPIRAETLERFAEMFSCCGFRREAFYPCYGMAETTLFVSGGLKMQSPVIRRVQETSLEENQVLISNKLEESRLLVGCGHAWLNQTIAIVNPESLTECPDGSVGEIWVSGTSVTQGYWNQPELTEQVFHAYLADTQNGPFLRTGDLGFLQDGELFVTGRLKDVIIIRGRNHYPQDIELTVEQSHPAIIPNRSAAFSVEVAGEEKLVTVAEVERRYQDRRQPLSDKKYEGVEKRNLSNRRQKNIDPGFEVELEQPITVEAVVGHIRQAVTANHGLQVYVVVLLRVGSIPQTSSGKIQRYACRTGFLNGSLNVVYESRPAQ